MQTTLPPTADGGSPLPEGGTPPPPGDTTFGAVAFGVVTAVLALIFAAVAIVFAGDDGSSDTLGGAGAGSATVDLSEFALEPAASDLSTAGSSDPAAGGTHAGHQMSDDDYQQMSQAMTDTIAEYPRRDRDSGVIGYSLYGKSFPATAP